MAELNATINKSVVLKMCNQLNIEQLDRCSVRIRHNDKCVKCIFFVAPVDGPGLFWMPDIELVGSIRVMCETTDNKTNKRKFDV